MRLGVLSLTVTVALMMSIAAMAQPQIVDQHVIGVTNSLRCFEHNGARHVTRDAAGRSHMVWLDGYDAWYARGEQAADGSATVTPAQRINDDATKICLNAQAGLPSTRGVAVATWKGANGTIVHIVWLDAARRVWYRRVSQQGGQWVWGGITDTTMSNVILPTVVVDSTGRIHVAAERSYRNADTSLRYATSLDGVVWTESAAEYRSATNSGNYRFPALAVDQQDRVHMVFQAEGYEGNGPNAEAMWWAPRYMVLSGGVWTGQPNPLGAYPQWGPPPAYRDILFAYPNLHVDASNNLHLVWHGTARSGVFAKDDTYHLVRRYIAATDTWGPWTELTTLHERIHYDVSAPLVPGGEDYDLTWVPSLADDPVTGDLYIMLMFGLFDDEIGPSDTSVATEAGLVWQVDGVWDLGLLNLTNTPGGRNWYPNVAPRVYLHPNGRRYLDMLWIEGVHNPLDVYEQNYDVIYSVLDLGPANPGDLDNDGDVDLADVGAFLAAVSGEGTSTLTPAADLDGDGDCDVNDWTVMAGRLTGP